MAGLFKEGVLGHMDQTMPRHLLYKNIEFTGTHGWVIGILFHV
jgi:hypothetical protein